MTQTSFYFAYGSNMKSSKLLARTPSARKIANAYLPGKRLVCNKKSKDGSGKANLEDDLSTEVWGVVYQIDPADFPALDCAEKDYQRVPLAVTTAQGENLIAEVYISTVLTSEPVLYDWYKNEIMEGAVEHGLPADYIEKLRQLPAKADNR